MILEFPYGDEKIDVKIPDKPGHRVLKSRTIPSISDLRAALVDAIDNPTSGKPLFSMIDKNSKIGIVLPDATRYISSDKIIPPLTEILLDRNIEKKSISFMIATGTHRPPTADEINHLIPGEIQKEFDVYIHDAFDKKEHVNKGMTSRGTPICLNKWIFGQDMLILLGQIQFHYHAGFSGGRKIILCGMGAGNSIMKNHSYTMNPEEPDGIETKADTGKLSDNPVHKDLCEVAEAVGDTFLLNVVMNDEGKISNFYSGDIFQAHKTGAEWVKENFSVTIPEKADVVLASASGSPFDSTLYQAHKAYDNAVRALKPNGSLYLMIRGEEGLGPKSFAGYLENFSSVSEHRKEVENRFSIVGHTTYSLRLKTEKFKTIFLTGLPPSPLEKLGIKVFNDRIKFLEDFYTKNNKIVYYIPNAMKILPVPPGNQPNEDVKR